MGNLFEELKRRNVVRVGIAYAVGGGLIIELLDTIAPRLGMPEWVPTFFIVAVLIGLPVTLFLSWAYELTPQGLKKTAEVDADDSIAHSTGRRLDFVIIGMLVLALGYFVWDKFGAEPAVETSEVTAKAESSGLHTIAVLPFVNMSSDPDQEYFSDGISEELLNVLVRVEGLKVSSRTSSFSFKGKDTPIPEIAAALNVDHILEGSVRSDGNRVRITAQLIDVKTDSHLWSQTFDRELDDIFAIQDEISKAIVSQLRLTLGGTQTPFGTAMTTNSKAYQAYLKGRYFWNLRTGPDLLTAVGHFEEAARLDPEYAEAWAGLADVYKVLPPYDFNDRTALSRLELGRRAARRALEINPSMGRAYVALAGIEYSLFHWQLSLEYFERGLQLAPQYATGWQWYGNLLSGMGRHDEAVTALEKALEIDPVSRIINNNYAEALRGGGRTEEAIKQFEYAITLDPDFAFHHLGLAATHLAVGNFPEARASFRSAAQISGENLDSVLARVDRIEEFATTGQVVEVPPEQLSLPIFTRREPALYLMLSGHVDAGFALLDEALDAGYNDAGLYWVLYDHDFRNFWAHPRFKSLRARAGLEEKAK